MPGKYEWRKAEKALYLPAARPVRIAVPPCAYLMVDGRGDPNGPEFAACVEALYALSYAIRMMPKKGIVPEGYMEYAVYPLEATWVASADESVPAPAGKDYVYTAMIRQPAFVTRELVEQVRTMTAEKKKLPLLKNVVFDTVEEGECIQMLHVGPYDGEPESFARMDEWCRAAGLVRCTERHREIYLTDPRKTDAARWKTVLRYGVREA